ncbi:MAG: four helix bundle protein [Opitutales bacterium]|nr:four helix bundle protein [Opitutales bacterium]
MTEDSHYVVEESAPLYRSLRIYEAAGDLSDEVWDLVAAWPGLARETVGKQLIRAADSIAANLSEGSGRGTTMEILRFARIARGSLCETQHWIRRAAKRSLIEQPTATEIEDELTVLLKQLNAYITAQKRKLP